MRPKPEAVTFDGRFYQLRGARNLPAPTHAIPIAIGGGGDRILGIVARYADTWDCPDTYLDRHVERSAKLDELLRVTGRPVVRSLQVPMAVQPLSAELLSYRPTLGLGAFGEPARMVERVRELAGGAHYDQLALEPIGAQSFYRALEMLPAFAEALTR